jgi:hypothetical protein
MPKILIPKFDILIVDQIGKNFSGDGADPNITAPTALPMQQGDRITAVCDSRSFG